MTGLAGTIISQPEVPPLLTVSPALNNYQISPGPLDTRHCQPSHLVVPAVTLTALLSPLVLTAPLTPLPGLLGTGTLTADILLDCDGGALLVAQPGLYPTLAEDDWDGPGPGDGRHTPGEAGAGGAASVTPVNLNTRGETEGGRLEPLRTDLDMGWSEVE